MKKKLFILYAPTASGKTEVSLRLAQRIALQIVSADSRQVFRFLDIGTAKASAHERASVVHHCIDIVNPDEHYSAGRFRSDAITAHESIAAKGDLTLVVGGSGLYIKALLGQLFHETLSEEYIARRDHLRDSLSSRLVLEGREALYEELLRIDPESAEKYADRNPSRITRALEYYYLNGMTLSSAHRNQKQESEFDSHVFVIDHDREALNERIGERTQAMWSSGLVAEVESILQRGYSSDIQALHSVGYSEALRYLRNEISADEAQALIAQNTRRYAKRQRTWARHQFPDAELLRGTMEEIVHSLEKSILKFNQP